MKYWLITENGRSLDGMRLAGVAGQLVADAAEAEQAVADACADPDIAVLLMTSRAADWIPATVQQHKLSGHQPLLTIIPSPGENVGEDMITNLIRDAIGVKI